MPVILTPIVRSYRQNSEVIIQYQKKQNSVSVLGSVMFIVYQGNSLSHGMPLVIMKALGNYTQSDFMVVVGVFFCFVFVLGCCLAFLRSMNEILHVVTVSSGLHWSHRN